MSCNKNFVWNFPTDFLSICDFSSNTEVVGLDLDYQKITELKEYSFTSFESLESLSLTKNELTTIQNKAFNGLEQLTFLVLAYNNVSLIEPGAFDDLVSTKNIFLQGNPYLNSLTTKYVSCFIILLTLQTTIGRTSSFLPFTVSVPSKNATWPFNIRVTRRFFPAYSVLSK